MLQIAGQKAELFACFDGRSCQDDSVNLFCSECVDGHCDGKVGLARSGRSYAENYRTALYRVNIFLLTECFGLYGFALGAYANAVVDAANNANGAANGFMGVGMMNMASGGVMGGVATNAQPAQQNQAQAGSKFCSNCGSPVSGAFCSNCGNKVA